MLRKFPNYFSLFFYIRRMSWDIKLFTKIITIYKYASRGWTVKKINKDTFEFSKPSSENRIKVLKINN